MNLTYKNWFTDQIPLKPFPLIAEYSNSFKSYNKSEQ